MLKFLRSRLADGGEGREQSALLVREKMQSTLHGSKQCFIHVSARLP